MQNQLPPPTVTTRTVETAEGREIAHTTKSSSLEGQPSVAAPRPNVSGGIVITGCSHIIVNYHTVTKEN